MLVENFPRVVDSGFTAAMETKLDEVEDNQVYWPDMIREFYTPFINQVEEVGKNLESQ
jgi:DNA topoisomerase-1